MSQITVCREWFSYMVEHNFHIQYLIINILLNTEFIVHKNQWLLNILQKSCTLGRHEHKLLVHDMKVNVAMVNDYYVLSCFINLYMSTQYLYIIERYDVDNIC